MRTQSWMKTHTRTDRQWINGWHVTNRWTFTQKEIVILASGLVELLLSSHEHRHEPVCVSVWVPVVCQAALFNWFILKSWRRFPVKLIPYGGTINDWEIIRQGKIHEVIYLSIILSSYFWKRNAIWNPWGNLFIYYSLYSKKRKSMLNSGGNLFIHYSLYL